MVVTSFITIMLASSSLKRILFSYREIYLPLGSFTVLVWPPFICSDMFLYCLMLTNVSLHSLSRHSASNYAQALLMNSIIVVVIIAIPQGDISITIFHCFYRSIFFCFSLMIICITAVNRYSVSKSKIILAPLYITMI